MRAYSVQNDWQVLFPGIGDDPLCAFERGRISPEAGADDEDVEPRQDVPELFARGFDRQGALRVVCGGIEGVVSEDGVYHELRGVGLDGRGGVVGAEHGGEVGAAVQRGDRGVVRRPRVLEASAHDPDPSRLALVSRRA